ncbi:MAG: acyl-CoA dehydrogenase family protein [Pseudomonadales bacterium]|jgi:acyl-CoA dehydrogenase|nr:acyl-CoA dehydrogenase family protein [Pseudomonadales bacterium]MDP7356902.1 acyl-CoA dehydrogenase family protein [Pseudomonadales bacterium]MDP7596000.1 acyl-CoA dehydrogenase family protein [Pseudomonadales bacterium]HJN52776.1 acyl-CoA dehydrogenase family protein [Pseudomonadales bacterium]|tara:strand:- start:3 stop:329 length:327 start_codon:yes stop_codon:yes gene_type:complete
MNSKAFREQIRDWLQDNFPAPAEGSEQNEEDAKLWLDRLIGKGWTAPGWPTAYGGGGLDDSQHRILLQEMAAIGASVPAGGMGMGLIGPTLLEFGTEEQKQRHLTRIV